MLSHFKEWIEASIQIQMLPPFCPDISALQPRLINLIFRRTSMALFPLRPRQVARVRAYGTSSALYAASFVGIILFFTNDWRGRDILGKIPWYKRRYDDKPYEETLMGRDL